MSKPIKKLVDDYKSSSPKEIWIDGIFYNFIYGFLGAMVIVAITIKIDIAILVSYLLYYFFVGKVINRPKYVTSLGKFIVFPIPTALGAFIGYKVTPIIIQYLN
jgi:putative flippase GtrA|tara:strand:- start:67 stop:378 length:312 start_codon:yes stop_codon:yes gene_type:complete